uniref:Uncharacterized protein n=1 Tax=Tectiviridae sp. TaxID=2831614 RepID=A0A8S5VUB6_9VIRU|nr:MAG TPA: hypothetical protein [Tectiviridae sp.]
MILLSSLLSSLLSFSPILLFPLFHYFSVRLPFLFQPRFLFDDPII